MKKLGKLAICGQTFEVISASDQEVTKLEDAWGLCDPVEQKIYVEEAQSGEQLLDTLFHEGLHAIFDRSGLTDYCTQSMNTERGSDKARVFEESFIRILTPHLVAMVKSLGGIRLGKK